MMNKPVPASPAQNFMSASNQQMTEEVKKAMQCESASPARKIEFQKADNSMNSANFGTHIREAVEIVKEMASPAQISDEQAVKAVYPDARCWEHYANDWQVGIGTEFPSGSKLLTYANSSKAEAWSSARSRLEPVEAVSATPKSQNAYSGNVNIRKMQENLFFVDWGNVRFSTSLVGMRDLANSLTGYILAELNSEVAHEIQK